MPDYHEQKKKNSKRLLRNHLSQSSKHVQKQFAWPALLSARSWSPCQPWGPSIDRCLVGSDWTWVDNFLCCIRVHYWPAPRKAIDILKKKKKCREDSSWKRSLLPTNDLPGETTQTSLSGPDGDGSKIKGKSRECPTLMVFMFSWRKNVCWRPICIYICQE